MLEEELATILDYANLRLAWDRVRQNGGCAGTDGQTLSQFHHNLQVNLWALRIEVENGSYVPRPLLAVTVSEPGRRDRMLAIPSVRDRVLQTAVAQYLTPILEAEFEDCSYGYRPGRSVDAAARKVMRYRDLGYRWVVDADITRYFDEIEHSSLLLELSRFVTDHGIMKLVGDWLRTPIQDERTIWSPVRGVPQGSPISPLLSNLYLDWFDEQLLEKGQRLVRFADDFLVLCKTRNAAEDAMELTEDLLQSLDLRLNENKSRIVHFDDGFRFLGVHFLRTLVMKAERPAPGPQENHPTAAQVRDSLPPLLEQSEPPIPPALDEAEIDSVLEQESTTPPGAMPGPRLHSLYVSEQGARLSRDGESFCIHNEGELIRRIPARRLDQIMIFGNIQLTTPFITDCLQRGIPITLLTANGRYYGGIDTLDARNTELQRQQFHCTDDPATSLRIAREIVSAKIRNSRVILGRYARKRQLGPFDRAVAELSRLSAGLDKAQSLDAVRGFEGMAANHYFTAWRETLGLGWGFTGRKKRPPPDPINVLLSFGYTLLFQNVFSFIRARGLNTHVGFLHREYSGHPALASDLMEEFRAPVIDSVILSLLFNEQLQPSDFQTDPGGACLMSDIARRTYIRAIEAKMSSRLINPEGGGKIDYRRCLDLQVQRLVAVIRDPAQPYRPFVVR
ncbi:MAG: CRISPR-associated endonuclease Cas1 [Gammaproteobacteria bacterium RIFOXYA12_FULL_61_12]|nr:MAG: CRISPR-associated endonuclease Cas1 [Gammaproteobacteria bacterium RIFOXYA12_FULL_61_12]OGT91293.1 MAG: CRISPR-associated endonuclease Cas1 [Gammaproteobacteria bacterium RIFOXYD12_FULL_61_37]